MTSPSSEQWSALFEPRGVVVAPGFVGATVPEALGGHGLDLTSYLVLVEELAYCWGSLRSSVNTCRRAGTSKTSFTHSRVVSSRRGKPGYFAATTSRSAAL